MTPASTPDRWLRSRLGQTRGRLLGALALAFAAGALLLPQALLLARVIHAAVFQRAGLAALTGTLLGLTGLIGARAVLRYLSERQAFLVALKLKRELRAALAARLFDSGPIGMRRWHAGELAQLAIEAVEALEPYFTQYLPQAALAVFVPLAIVVVLLPVDWLSASVLALTAPLIPIAMVFIGKAAEALHRRQWQRLARLGAYFVELVRGLTTLKLFNASRAEARFVARAAEDYRRSTLAVLRVAFLSSLALEFLATGGIALVAVLVGFRLLWGDVGFAAGLAALLLAPEFYAPLRALGTAYHARLAATAAAEQLQRLLDSPAVIPHSGRRRCFFDAPPRIQFERVDFGYESGQRVLREFTLTIEPGEHLALAGASGSGKSTLGFLLLGLVAPQRGSLRVNGMPLAELDLKAWHAALAWVPQKPQLIRGTFGDNLRLANPRASANEIDRALHTAALDRLVATLPQGLDTPVGDLVMRISGGELQRIAVARALLRDARVVLLDEPSAHLDGESEARLGETIAALASERTLVHIAHRLHTLREADRIVVLEEGRIIESGPPAVLARGSGRYAQLLAAAQTAQR